MSHKLSPINRVLALFKKAEEISKMESNPTYIARHKARAKKREGKHGTAKRQ